MSADQFFRAAIPEPFTVLGLKLRPFSAGHIILLHRIESAFVIGGPQLLPDLISSVFLCSLNFRDGWDSLDNRAVDKFMRKWQRKIGHFDFLDKCKLFARYIAEGSEEPGWQSPEGGGTIDAPKVQVVRCALLSKTNITEAEFLDRPWGLSLWDYYTLYALEGAVTLLDKSKVLAARDAAIRVAEILKARRGAPCQN